MERAHLFQILGIKRWNNQGITLNRTQEKSQSRDQRVIRSWPKIAAKVKLQQTPQILGLKTQITIAKNRTINKSKSRGFAT